MFGSPSMVSERVCGPIIGSYIDQNQCEALLPEGASANAAEEPGRGAPATKDAETDPDHGDSSQSDISSRLTEAFLVGDRLRVCRLVRGGAAFPGEILGHRRRDHHRHVSRPVGIGADRPSDGIVDGLSRRLKELEAGAIARCLVILTDCVIKPACRPNDRQRAILEGIYLVEAARLVA